MAENHYDLDYTGSMVDRILDTGYDLQNQGYIFRGLASHYTGTPTERTWLIAPTGSTGFGLSSPVPPGSIGICMYNGSSWSAEVLNTLTLDSAPTTGSGNGITSGAVKTLAESITNAIGQLEQSVSDRFTSLELEDTTGSLQAELLSITLKYVFEGEEEALTSLSILAATAEKAGLMSAADKRKLDAFVTNIRSLRIQDTTAQADQGTEITNTLKWTIGGVTEAITAFTLYAATTSKAGLMSAADKTALDTLPSLINAGYLYAGIATPSTVPSSTSAKIFYIAIEGGTYTNFGNLNVTQGINILYKSGDAWSVAHAVGIDDEPTAGSDNLVKSVGVFNNLSAFDISELNATENPHILATYTNLSAALKALPDKFRKGGMSVKFVQSSDNKYVQYRLIANSWRTDTYFWERYNDIATSNQQDSDLDISDEQENVLVIFQNGGIKTKNFDSSKDATEKERGLMSAADKTKLNTIEEGAEVNDIITDDVNVDLNISDENDKVLACFRDGEFEVKNFNTRKTPALNDSDYDFSVSDENENNIIIIREGNIITKNFNSEDIDYKKKYVGKLVSILGDSLSSYGVPDSRNQAGTYNYSYYPTQTCRYSQLGNVTEGGQTYDSYQFDVNNMWWMRLIKQLGAELGINESWRGSAISSVRGDDKAFSKQSRIDHLGLNGTPDLILVVGGGNDFHSSVTIGTFDTTQPPTSAADIAALGNTTFAEAMRTMLIRLQYSYPNSEIAVATNTIIPSYYSLSAMNNFIAVMKQACEFFGVKFIDGRQAFNVYSAPSMFLSDNIHPNIEGMKRFANIMYNNLIF